MPSAIFRTPYPSPLSKKRPILPAPLRPVAERGAYVAIRTGVGLVSRFGIEGAGPAARGLGKAFARAKFNRRRVERAAGNIAQAFPEKSPEEHRRLAVAAYQHLMLLGVEVAALPRVLTEETWPRHIELGNLAPGLRALLESARPEGDPRRGPPCVLVTGHCGNWEVLGYALALLGFPMHALYRPLDLRPLDDWVRRVRAAKGLELIDKFGATEALPRLLEAREPIGFVADQNAGDRGLFVPYLGRLASTYKSVGLLAIQHKATVICGMARRLDPGTLPDEQRRRSRGLRYRIELHDVITAEDYLGQPDPLFYLTARYRRAIEAMVRSAPEQYLWMHRIWKSRPRHERDGKPFPPVLREKMLDLPWLDEAAVDALIARSDADARRMAELGTDRLP